MCFSDCIHFGDFLLFFTKSVFVYLLPWFLLLKIILFVWMQYERIERRKIEENFRKISNAKRNGETDSVELVRNEEIRIFLSNSWKFVCFCFSFGKRQTHKSHITWSINNCLYVVKLLYFVCPHVDEILQLKWFIVIHSILFEQRKCKNKQKLKNQNANRFFCSSKINQSIQKSFRHMKSFVLSFFGVGMNIEWGKTFLTAKIPNDR